MNKMQLLPFSNIESFQAKSNYIFKVNTEKFFLDLELQMSITLSQPAGHSLTVKIGNSSTAQKHTEKFIISYHVRKTAAQRDDFN